MRATRGSRSGRRSLSEQEGRGAVWTEERGTGDEGRRCGEGGWGGAGGPGGERETPSGSGSQIVQELAGQRGRRAVGGPGQLENGEGHIPPEPDEPVGPQSPPARSQRSASHLPVDGRPPDVGLVSGAAGHCGPHQRPQGGDNLLPERNGPGQPRIGGVGAAPTLSATPLPAPPR